MDWLDGIKADIANGATNLTLEDEEILDAGAKQLAPLLVGTQATTLCLKRCRIDQDDKGTAALAPVLKDTALTYLDLYGNDIGDIGAAALAPGLVGSQLTNVRLTGNFIADAGAQALLDVLPQTKIEQMDLLANPISINLRQKINRVLEENKARNALGVGPALATPSAPVTAKPTSKIDEASIIEQLSRDALDDGIGI